MMTYDAHESFVAVKVVLNGCFQVDGIATKVAVGISRTQLLLHPSPLILPPSSHCSTLQVRGMYSKIPFPHPGTQNHAASEGKRANMLKKTNMSLIHNTIHNQVKRKLRCFLLVRHLSVLICFFIA